MTESGAPPEGRGIGGYRSPFPPSGTALGALDRDERFEAEAIPHLRALYGTAYRMTRNAHDAEDLVQETYLRAYRGFDRFEPGTKLDQAV